MNTYKHIVAILVAASFFVTADVFASAGNIIYAYGDNYALNKNGKKRTISKGAEIFSGDTLVTGARGRMHLRFSDGGMVSVYPKSEYKIDEYDFVEGDESKQKGFFSLLRGGARQISGLLGKIKRDNFKFRTSVATIGIRGTGFFAQLCNGDCYDDNGNLLPDGMYVKNNSGIISMTNEAGVIELAQGQSAFAASSSNLPEQINEPPAPYNLASRDVETFDFSIRDVIRDANTLVDGVIDPPIDLPMLPVAKNYEVLDVVLSSASSLRQTFNINDPSAPTTIVATGTDSSINTFNVVQSPDGDITYNFTPGSSVLESGASSALGVVWSRWTGNAVFTVDNGSGATQNIASDSNYHMIAALALTQTLPASGTLTYTGTGGTSPTFIDSKNQSFVGKQTLTFDIAYGTTNTISNVNLVADFSETPLATSVVVSSLNGTDTFTNSASLINVTGTCAGSAQCSSMSGSMSINLVGAGAAGAFGSYHLSQTAAGQLAGTYVAEGAPAVVGVP